MSLSKEDSEQLWQGVKQRDYRRFNRINNKFLNPQGATLRHLPTRLYLPHTALSRPEIPPVHDTDSQSTGKDDKGVIPGSVRVVQGLVPLSSSPRKSSYEVPGVGADMTSGQRQTVGTMLRALLPNLFPNARGPCLIAAPVLHGAVLPLDAPVEELVRTSAYVDGWLHVAFVML